MTDPVSSTISAQGAKSFGALIDRLLGPTFELWGTDMRAAIERKRNVQEVARKAMEKTNLEDDHAIPARVAADIFDKAQWADNEFVAEYLSGVLASSRTQDGKNDSGVPWTALVGRLSSDQLALHWLAYASFQRKFQGTPEEDFWPILHKQLVLDYIDLYTALAWADPKEGQSRIFDALYGLEREGLIDSLSHGSGEYLGKTVTFTSGRQYDEAKGYVTFGLTQQGIKLFLQATGLGQTFFVQAFNHDVTQAVEKIVDLPTLPSCTTTEDFPPAES